MTNESSSDEVQCGTSLTETGGWVDGSSTVALQGFEQRLTQFLERP